MDEKKIKNIEHDILRKYKNKKKLKQSNSFKKKIHNIKKKIKIKKKFYTYASSNEKISISENLLYHPMKKNTFWQSSRFGIRFNRSKKKYEMHGGVDFAAPTGTPVYSAEEGVVFDISDKNVGYGKSIVIKHYKNNIKTRYAHLSKILVYPGQIVKANDLIGLVGSTGNTRGKQSAAHLHFEVIINNKKYNPILHIRKPTS